MPRKPPTACRHAGCAALVDKPGYCDEHRREASGWNTQARTASRHERGYGSEWTRTRPRIFKRDCGLCQPCLRVGLITKACAVDHVTPKSEGGTDDDDNLQSICDPCHVAKTAEESARAKARRR
jgi:5-methylcytosine-specific restriction protein A